MRKPSGEIYRQGDLATVRMARSTVRMERAPAGDIPTIGHRQNAPVDRQNAPVYRQNAPGYRQNAPGARQNVSALGSPVPCIDASMHLIRPSDYVHSRAFSFLSLLAEQLALFPCRC